MINLAQLSNPTHINSRDVRGILNVNDLEWFRDAVDRCVFQIGEEHSAYVDKSYRRGFSAEDVLNDSERFTHLAQKKNFFKDSAYGFAAGRILKTQPENFNHFGLWDFRAFIGRKGQKSSLHFDWNLCPNLLLNTEGIKIIRLLHPQKSLQLKGYTNFTLEKVSSWDFEIEIGPEEAVLIPAFWWHQVEYLSEAASISVRLRPRSELIDIMKSVYPTWKVIYLFGMGKMDKNFCDSILNQVGPQDTTLERYQKIEGLLDRHLLQPVFNHAFYAQHAKAYLTKHFRLKPEYEIRYNETYD